MILYLFLEVPPAVPPPLALFLPTSAAGVPHRGLLAFPLPAIPLTAALCVFSIIAPLVLFPLAPAFSVFRRLGGGPMAAAAGPFAINEPPAVPSAAFFAFVFPCDLFPAPVTVAGCADAVSRCLVEFAAGYVRPSSK